METTNIKITIHADYHKRNATCHKKTMCYEYFHIKEPRLFRLFSLDIPTHDLLIIVFTRNRIYQAAEAEMNVKKISGFALGPIGAALVGFISLPIITWIYSPEDVGRIALLNTVISFSILLFSLGMDQAYVREYHEVLNKPSLLLVVFLPGFIFLTGTLVVLMIFPGIFSRLLFDINDNTINSLVAVCIVAAFVTRFLSLILRMEERAMAYSMSNMLPKIFFLLIIIVYLIGHIGTEFVYLILANSVSIVLVALLFGWNTRKVWMASIASTSIDMKMLKFILGYSLPLVIGGIAYWGLSATDKIMLRTLSTFDELGIFSVAVSFAGAAAIFQAIFSVVWAPTVYKWVAHGVNTDKIGKVREYVLLAVVLLFCLVGMFSWTVNLILPEYYHSKVPYLLVTCMAAPLLYTLSETTVVGIGITRKTGYAMLATIIALVVNLIGNISLIPQYGATGAAVSTATSFWIFFVLRTEFSCLVWQKISRFKLYLLTATCIVLSFIYNFIGMQYQWHFILIWGILFSTILLVYKSENVQLIQSISTYLRSYRQH